MRPLIGVARASVNEAIRTSGARRVLVLATWLLAATPSASALQTLAPAHRADGYRPPTTRLVAGAEVARFADMIPPESYTGRDSVTGVPRYVTRTFSPEERHLLREHFGV